MLQKEMFYVSFMPCRMSFQTIGEGESSSRECSTSRWTIVFTSSEWLWIFSWNFPAVTEIPYETFDTLKIFIWSKHLVKIFHIRSFSGPYFPAFRLNTKRYEGSLQMRESTDQKNSEHGHFSRSEMCIYKFLFL